MTCYRCGACLGAGRPWHRRWTTVAYSLGWRLFSRRTYRQRLPYCESCDRLLARRRLFAWFTILSLGFVAIGAIHRRPVALPFARSLKEAWGRAVSVIHSEGSFQ